ncbi:hypothetical protein LCGC14_1762570 [marine sediment metagenome]|uniref:Uncharacterized protein n=1 Tax=marine sediment metagenome TaxID=412755 RepID=A0A0F9K077_9ZZZZ
MLIYYVTNRKVCNHWTQTSNMNKQLITTEMENNPHYVFFAKNVVKSPTFGLLMNRK